MDLESMTTPLESSTSSARPPAVAKPSGWLKVGVIAAASALAGGVAAAWWYRKTLTKLRQAEGRTSHPDFSISGDDRVDEA